MTTVDDTSDRSDPAHPAYVGSKSPANAPPRHETVVRLPKVGSEAEKALVEVLGLGLLNHDRRIHGWPNADTLSHLENEDADAYRSSATAALSAIRAWEGARS